MRLSSAALAIATIAVAAVSAAADHDQATTIHSCLSEDTNDGIVFYNTELTHDINWDAVESDGVMLHRIEMGQPCESLGLCGTHCPATKEVFDVATSTLAICTLKPASDAYDAKIKYDKDGNFKGGECQYKCSDLEEEDDGKDDNGDGSEKGKRSISLLAKHKLADRADFTKPKGPKV